MRTKQLPINSCSYTVTYDLMTGSRFLQNLKIKYDDNPILTRILRNKPFKGCQTNYYDAFQ